MRFVLPALVALFLLPSCSREPDFDEKYSELEKQLQKDAKEMDSDLDKALKAEPGAPQEDSVKAPATNVEN